jgi:hypothetical protein
MTVAASAAVAFTRQGDVDPDRRELGPTRNPVSVSPAGSPSRSVAIVPVILSSRILASSA